MSLDLIIGSTRKPELVDVARARLVLLSDDEAVRKATIDAFADVYAASFTEKELGELLAFYRTGLGQKLAALPIKLETEGRDSIARATAQELEKAEERSKVIRTKMEMSMFSSAVRGYEIAHGSFPSPASSMEDLAKQLEPFLKNIRTTDAWGNHSATPPRLRHFASSAEGLTERSTRQVPDSGESRCHRMTWFLKTSSSCCRQSYRHVERIRCQARRASPTGFPLRLLTSHIVGRLLRTKSLSSGPSGQATESAASSRPP